MKLYSGIDLHTSCIYLAIIDEKGKRIFKGKLTISFLRAGERRGGTSLTACRHLVGNLRR